MANFEELSKAVLSCTELYYESDEKDGEKDTMATKAKAIAAKIKEKITSVFGKLKKVNFTKTIKAKVHKEASDENSAKIDKLYAEINKLNIEYVSTLTSKSSEDAVKSFNEIYFGLRDGSLSGDSAISKMESELNKVNSINEKLLDILEKALKAYEELSECDDVKHTLDIMEIKKAINEVKSAIAWNKGICKSVGVNITESMNDKFDELNSEIQLITEGANVELFKIFRDNKKKMAELSKSALSKGKSGDYEGAAKDFKECSEYLKKQKDEIRKLDGDFGSFLTAGFFLLITSPLKICAALIIGMNPYVEHPNANKLLKLSSINDTVNSIDNIVNQVKDASDKKITGGEAVKKSFGTFRAKVIAETDKMIGFCEAMTKVCEAKKSEVKESADYEDFEEGAITNVANDIKNAKESLKSDHVKKLDELRKSLDVANASIKKSIACAKDKDPKGYKKYIDSAISEINNAKSIEDTLSEVDFKDTETITKLKNIGAAAAETASLMSGYKIFQTATQDPGDIASITKFTAISGTGALISKKLNQSIKNNDYKTFLTEFNRSMKVINKGLKKALKYGEKLKKKGYIIESAEDLSDIYVSYMEGDISIDELNAITESAIDYDIDDLYEEKVSAGSVLKTVALVVASAAGIGAIIAKIISDVKISETINSHADLKSINDKIKKKIKDIKVAYDVMDDLYDKCEKDATDCKRLYELFASKSKEEFDGTKTVKVVVGRDEHNVPIYSEKLVNQYRTVANPDYDPKKAAEWKAKSDELVKLSAEINKNQGILIKGITELSVYYKDLKKIAKKYATTDSSAIERLDKACDESITKCNNAVQSLSEKASSSMKESTEDINDIKLNIFEAFENGEITKEERDNLLSQI